jgi:hypothetical protein
MLKERVWFPLIELFAFVVDDEIYTRAITGAVTYGTGGVPMPEKTAIRVSGVHRALA